MAKRKKRRGKSPNISQAAIERARQQIDPTETDDAAPSDESEAEEVVAEKAATSVDEPESREVRRARRREHRQQAQPGAFQYSQRRKKEDMDSAEIEQMLANPTKFVTEEELQAEYHYVIADLRSMGLLAAGLMVFLVALAQFI